jgi:hypothetical protein
METVKAAGHPGGFCMVAIMSVRELRIQLSEKPHTDKGRLFRDAFPVGLLFLYPEFEISDEVKCGQHVMHGDSLLLRAM